MAQNNITKLYEWTEGWSTYRLVSTNHHHTSLVIDRKVKDSCGDSKWDYQHEIHTDGNPNDPGIEHILVGALKQALREIARLKVELATRNPGRLGGDE